MDETDAGSESSAVWMDSRALAARIGISVEDAKAFLDDQLKFGEIVGDLRHRYPEQFAHAQALHDPPSFLVKFVGGVPPGVDDTFVGVSYPVRVSGDGLESEASLRAMQHRIGQLLMAEGVTNYSTGADTDRGAVDITVPVGWMPSSDALRDLLDDPRVVVATTDRPVWQPESAS